jgi:amidase
MTELWRFGAVELAGLIRKREVASREVVDAHLRRIEEVNGSVRAVTVTLSDAAMAAANRADTVLAAGAEVPALHGVPFTVKENIDVSGSPTTQGLIAFDGPLPMSMPLTSPSCVRRAPSRWPGPTSPTSASAGTPTMPCAARR